MRVVLAPGLALLGEATASDSPRHVLRLLLSLRSPRLRLGSFGVGLFRDCANDVPLRPFVFNHARFSFFFRFLLHFLYFFHFFWQVGSRWEVIVGSACQGAGDTLDGAGR